MIDAHLQVCINDLLHPTEKLESLLEELSTHQLDDIESTLIKIKKRKTQKDEQKLSNHDLASAQIIKSLENDTPEPIEESPKTDNTVTMNPTLESTNKSVHHELRTEIKNGVEWVSFVYSHNRVLRRYSIRTDIDQVDISALNDQFKKENCVYPRANLPKEEYKGNRWNYETECNLLGWKLAYLNFSEIAGKRGLIQRAVDSYRNRYPSMRSRRVARQEKLLKGTLRKRKHNDDTKQDLKDNTKSDTKTNKPKTISMEDDHGKYRIRVQVESIALDDIDFEFRKANSVYPRSLHIQPNSPFASRRQLEEAKWNELGWKLCWLNPKQLANCKNRLQRVLDVYRTKFLESPRHKKKKSGPTFLPSTTIDTSILTQPIIPFGTFTPKEESDSLYSSTADSMIDFHDCFSPNNIMLPVSNEDLLIGKRQSMSSSSSESSPYIKPDHLFSQSPCVKPEQDPLIDLSQFFHL